MTAVFASVLAGLALVSGGAAQSCGDIRIDYINNDCCSDTTCTIGIPACAEVGNGNVCYDGTNVVVKGLLESLGFENDRIVLKKDLIPDTNAAYDLSLIHI